MSRGRHVETAYLSLTRGDGGQNLIGNELGEALGVIRTEELLAARRVDRAQQFFTRAFDFGFSKDTIDTFKHWQRDSILGDVVRVVRAFRPHVIVAMFSGTPRDGHGHHQVSGLVAREAYRVSGDTVRFPSATFGKPWTPLKLYGNARYDPAGGTTLRFDVGEYSPLLGRSYAEIAGESRSQHKSQGFGAPQRKGPIFDALRREASRVNESAPASAESSIFDGIDTTWARFRTSVPVGYRRAVLDSLPIAIAEVRAAYNPFKPSALIPSLSRVGRLLGALDSDRDPPDDADLEASMATTHSREENLMQLATGLELESLVLHEQQPVGRAGRMVVSLYNRGRDTVKVGKIWTGPERSVGPLDRVIPPGGVFVDTLDVVVDSVSQPFWLRTPRAGAMFTQPVSKESETLLLDAPKTTAYIEVERCSCTVSVSTPTVFLAIDPVKGELRRQLAATPALSLTLDQSTQFAVANTEFLRDVNVHIRSADDRPRDARIVLSLPHGLTADSAVRSVRLAGYGAAEVVTFHLRGRLPPGLHRISVAATSSGETFTSGYQLVDYDHIRRQRIYAPAVTTLSAVDMRVPRTLRVAYIAGVSDNVAPMLAQLGIPVTVIAAENLARADLQPYTTVVIGPRAYESHPALLAANPHLFEFARKGGTVVVQYGQYEMTQPGVMPYPITLVRPADRVTEEDSPVTIVAPTDKLLQFPNRIGADDFAGWVQERALYMPRTFDAHYHALLAMHDTGEAANNGAILVTPLGDGQYIYTTLSIFRQLPAGVPGGARVFLNLLSAGLVSNLNP